MTNGDILRLLVNYPPRCGKTLAASICWPAWTWARTQRSYLSGPAVKFLCGSYSNTLSLQNSNTTRRLIESPWYQARWGESFEIRDDQNAKAQFDNTEGGSRIATSVGGSLLGIGGNIIEVDDPHNTNEVGSDPERERVQTWWRELSSTRLNDPKQSAIAVIMQRLHEEDVSGLILGADDAEEWTHLMIPMSYDSRRHCVTVLKWDEDGEPEKIWEDPRTQDGELMWPERFGPRQVRSLQERLGPYMASGRLQQMPAPAGGGIFRREWWQLYPPQGETFSEITGKPLKPLEFPAMDYIIASVDTALTEKEENDWTACTVWGAWRNENDLPRIMLMDAWHDRLEFRPLVDRIIKTCEDVKVDRLLIEAKANGISVAQEIGRLVKNRRFGVSLVVPKGDKVARAHAITHLFAAGMVYAPDRKWADMVMDECSVFPKGAHDDLVDTCFVRGTQIATKRGSLNIEDVIVGDAVLTPFGWRHVTRTWMSGFRPVITAVGLTGTPNHPIFTFDKGYTNLDSVTQANVTSRLTLCGLIRIIRLIRLNSMASSLDEWEGDDYTTSHKRPQTPEGKNPRGFMPLSGNISPASLCRTGVKFITKMVIPLIVALRIWSVYRAACTVQCLSKTWITYVKRSILSGLGRWLLNGINLKPAVSGISAMFSNPYTDPDISDLRFARLDNIPASGADVNSSGRTSEIRYVQPGVSPLSQSFLLANLRLSTRIMPVFNLEVEGARCYYANGILVHNCTQALKHLRDIGFAMLREERDDDLRPRAGFAPAAPLPYQV